MMYLGQRENVKGWGEIRFTFKLIYSRIAFIETKVIGKFNER